MNGQNNRNQVRDRVRRLIDFQGEFNEKVHLLSQETSDPEVERVLGEIAIRGLENIHQMSRLLAIKCAT